MTPRRLVRRLAHTLLAAGLLASTAPAFAAIVPTATVVTVSTLPAYPDGANGWFRTEPFVYVAVSEDAQLRWGWDSLEDTLTITGGPSAYVDEAPEGVHSFVYDALSASGSTSGSTLIKTDSTAPSRPSGLTAAGFPGPGVSLSWGESTDAVSGVARYVVYRDTNGPPFTYADKVGETTGTSFDEAGSVSVWRNAAGATTLRWDAVSDAYRYAVSAVDEAGNESLLAEAVLAGGEYDALEVRRSVDGAAYSHVATLAVDATAFTDVAPPDGTLLYTLRGVDSAGTVLGESTPAPVLLDTVAPPAPAPALAPVYTPDGPATFRLTWPAWSPVADTGSGLLSSVLSYGSDTGMTQVTPDGQVRTLEASTPSAYWTAHVRSEDRAGNVSVSAACTARNVGTTRLAGADRIGTSRAVATAAFASADTAVFASSLDFPDALAASSLAGAVDGPVVLVGRGALPSATIAMLADLGVRDGYVIGGAQAIQPATFSSIDAALPGTLTRVAGRDRYATAAAVARKSAAVAGKPKRAFIVSGTVFADALSVGPAAYSEGSPVLFANADAVPRTTLSALGELSVLSSVVIVGGKAAVTPAADALLHAVRVAGPDRYATSRAFADWAVEEDALCADAPVLVTGANFPDGLSSAPLAGKASSPLLLTSDARHTHARTWLVEHRAELERVWFVGGVRALSDALRLAMWTAVSKP